MKTTWTKSANSLIASARLSAGYCTQIEILENALLTCAGMVDSLKAREPKEDEARRGYTGGMPERMPLGPYDVL